MKKVSFIRQQKHPHWVGDGFPVRTIFSYNNLAKELSPFLLMDYAGPAEFPPVENKRRGVEDHPHRGFETVTIVYAGEVEHRDSSGGGGLIGPGDVQWMTAGSGVVHQEFHGPDFAKKGGSFEMIQLWVNLSARNKKASPAYQNITRDQIPSVDIASGAGHIRVIAGAYGAAKGPARTFSPMNVWDVRLKAGAEIAFHVNEGETTALFLLKGHLRADTGEEVSDAELMAFDRQGENFSVKALKDSTFLFLNGQPIDEPIVGYGPFVMNSQDEIRQAMADYQAGRLGKIEQQ